MTRRSPLEPRVEHGTVTRALWYESPGIVRLREEKLDAPAPGEVRVRALHGAVSRGTESLVMRGRVPASEYGRMRAPLMTGDFPFPVKYGYAVVGRVETGPPEFKGRAVFALHPHQAAFNLTESAITPVPDGVPVSRAILAANMETALNAVWDAAPGPADRIAVVGAGVVGALTAWLCGRLPRAEVTLIDIDPGRGPLARALGVGFESPDRHPRDCDLVIHASGHPAGLATAIAAAGEEATVLEMSWYGDGDVPVPLGGAFHSRRLRLVSSQVGRVAASHRPRWSHRRRLAAALDLLAEPCLDALIEAPVRFDDLPACLPAILAPASGILCQRIDYDV